MLNRTVLVGRITKDPELKQTTNGISYVNFTIAVNRTYVSDQGERQADFISCVVWRKQAENLARYIHKGSLIGIDGKIQTRNYEVDGVRRYVTEVLCDSIQFLEAKGSNNNNNNNGQEVNPFEDEITHVNEDDLPF